MGGQTTHARHSVQCSCFRRHSREPQNSRRRDVDLRRVRLERVNSRGEYGYLVFVSHDDDDVWQEGSAKGLVVHISGDTLYCLTTLLRNEPCSRPFPLDILSSLINSQSSQAMEVLKVAIVALKGDTFMGRIYFGDSETGEITMDRDIRPSDATYLAEKLGAPMYVSADVFTTRATSFRRFMADHPECDHSDMSAAENEPRDSHVTEDDERSTSNDYAEASDSEAEREKERQEKRSERAVKSYLTERCKRAGILQDDPELIKMIKRSLMVAAAEEDYKHAARLRDLPAMATYRRMHALRAAGEDAEAYKLQDELDNLSSSWTFAEADA